MPELRWILLALGVALILGLWWWETRRPRSGYEFGDPPPRARTEPTLEGVAEPEPPAATVSERIQAPRRPPLIEIPEDLEVDVSAYIGRDRRRLPDPQSQPSAIARLYDLQDVPASRDLDDTANAELDADHRAPWVRTQPLERSEVAPKPEPEEAVSSDPAVQRTEAAASQRIVALRLIAGSGRWGGRQLREALEAEGLVHGRYSIFHRQREDGKTLYYVASMMEPGSFDLATMDTQEFPGVSLFGIVPGPLDAPTTFDTVLAAARHLVERLRGQIQDEQGSSLTAQRILNLRDELVHFEHRNRRLRRT
ncbi:MAG: hypothetical protein EPO25_07935 [Gammaproteobacteria bacterium]|nr:MAG: hypothetical protein EPO25_07935 [Gammaproteobacteria bacterium]